MTSPSVRRAAAAVATWLCAMDAHAQSAPSDSAAAARESFRAALKANAEHDLAAAWIAANRAAALWPAQSAYHATVALLAARRNDTLALAAAIRTLAGLEAGHEVLGDSAVQRMQRAAVVANSVAALRAATEPVARSNTLATLRDSTMFPEGMDIDARTGNAYVASIRHRTVFEWRPDGNERTLLAPDRRDMGAIFGVRVDPRNDVLWVTTSSALQSEGAGASEAPIAALLQIRVADGAILHRWDVPAAPSGHILGDLAIAANGDVFVTDSRSPVVYRLRSGADTLESITHPLFRSLQGVAPTPDGRAVYLADYSHGLLRLDLESGNVSVLAHEAFVSTLGLDGIASYGGSIVAVQNGIAPARIVRYTLDAAGTRIMQSATLDRNPLADEPTIGTVVNGAFVYVANSQWEKYSENGERIAARALTRPVLLRVPLW